VAFIFFKNPILGPLEDRLWQKARQRYVDEGGSPVNDIKQLDRASRRMLKKWVHEWKQSESTQLKPIWKEFKHEMVIHIDEALDRTLGKSDQKWYAIEKGSLPSFPEALAVPIAVLRQATKSELPGVIAPKIRFQALLPETRSALAEYAIEMRFLDVLERWLKEHRSFGIGRRVDRFVLVALIERDFYYLGTSQRASRIDMAILSTYKANHSDRDKSKHAGERAAIDDWRAFVPQRSDQRRFKGDEWGLDQGELMALAAV
jgi:hypothetical protein